MMTGRRGHILGIFFTPLNTGFGLLALLLALSLLLHAARKIPWKAWQQPTVFSAWCASIIVLTFVWRMHIPVQPDLHLHLLGVALLTLMFGRPLACIGAALAVLAYTGEFDGLWFNLGANILLLAALPSWLSDVILRATQKYLPQHMFVYLFGNGFFWRTAGAGRHRNGGAAGPPLIVAAGGDPG